MSGLEKADAWAEYVIWGGMPLDVLEDAFIFEKARRYDVKGKAYLDSPVKYYATDVGLRNARLGFRQIEETHLMENILYNELIRRGYAVDVGTVRYAETGDEKNRKAARDRLRGKPGNEEGVYPVRVPNRG